MLVVKIGGCNGSGKTSIVRAILENKKLTFDALYGKSLTRPEAYMAVNDTLGNGLKRIVVLGSYETVCGGMDTISDKEDRLALLHKYCVPGSLVIFEGLITGKTYGQMGAISEQSNHKGRWLYTFMDTPYNVCVQRVLQRRRTRAESKGEQPAPFDPERTMRPTFNSVIATSRRAEGAGHTVLWIDHTKTPAAAAKKLLADVTKYATNRSRK